MNAVLYDGSYAGFLSAIFDIYDHKIVSPEICLEDNGTTLLFGNVHTVVNTEEKAARVIKKLKVLLSREGYKKFYIAALCDLPGVTSKLFAFVQYILSSKEKVEYNYSDPRVLFVQQTAKKVHRERHRMEAFIRFQKSTDGLYFATVEPDFNVLPIIIKHFKSRYADQRWLIYDAKRKYGIYYDLLSVHFVTIEQNPEANTESSIGLSLDSEEVLFQQLWKQYFTSVNITSRKNTKLHVQHMPKRYWKYLTEKQ